MGCGASARTRYTEEKPAESETKNASDPEEAPPPDPKVDRGGAAETQPPMDKERSKAAMKQMNAEYQHTMQFLLKVPLLKRLPADEQPILAAAVERTFFAAAQVVIQQGDMGAEFYVIQEGEADVLVSQDGGATSMKVAQLKVGDYFGENALLRNEPRMATIVAKTALTALKITRDKFVELGLNEKLHFANRKAVGGGGGRRVETRQPDPKTLEERELMAQALYSNTNLNTVASLDEARVNSIIDVAWREDVPEGHAIIKEGDVIADYFYIVQAGSFEILQEKGDGSALAENVEDGGAIRRAVSSRVSIVPTGGSFGELALLYLVPRAATVVALEPSSVWVIDRGNFKNILMKASDAKIEKYVQLLDSVEVLTPLLREEKMQLAQALVEMHFSKEEVILRQGDPGTTFYILYEGEVVVIKDGREEVRLQAGTPQGSEPRLFGERALLNNEPRAATVMVTSQTARVLALDRDSFNLLLGPLQDIINASQIGPRRSGGGAKSGSGGRPKGLPGVGASGSSRPHVHREDLKKVGILGCGGFGVVELWEHKVTGETFAMKALSKGFIVRMGMQESVMNEKHILMMTNSPFIIKLYATYNSAQMLYFLMEPAMGGELYATYTKRGFHGSEKHARFYSAGVVLAFQHCHERRIIYRDLKPENLLFTDKGHIKVTDMGLAKFVIGKTYTTCGTPDYFAPELITSAGHTVALDWWTLGILIFELLTGHPPFESPYPMQIYSKVLKGISKVTFPESCRGNAEALVKGLLERDPAARLPMRPGGVANLKSAPWYDAVHFNWEAMASLTLTPPYIPVVRSKTDIANFSVRKEDIPKMVEYKDEGSTWDQDFGAPF